MADIMMCAIAVTQNSEEAEEFSNCAISLLTGLVVQRKINIMKRKGK